MTKGPVRLETLIEYTDLFERRHLINGTLRIPQINLHSHRMRQGGSAKVPSRTPEVPGKANASKIRGEIIA
jgi:hypothetical protein